MRRNNPRSGKKPRKPSGSPLGAWVLRGLLSKPALLKRQRRSAADRTLEKKTARFELRLKFKLKKRSVALVEIPQPTPPPLPPLPSTEIVALNQTAPSPQLAAPPVVLVPEPSHFDESEFGSTRRSLRPRELIRPGDKLRQSIEAFLLDQRSEHTRKAYGKDLKRFVQFLLLKEHQAQESGNARPESFDRVDRATLIAYKDLLLSEGLEHTTIDRHLSTLRSFFRWLVDDGLIEKKPAEGVRFLNPRKLSTTIGFSDEEVVRLLKAPDLHTRTGAQHYAILMILFYCGLRRSEVCGLRTSSLTLERDTHVVRLRGKGNSERLIVLTTPVWNALKFYFLIARKDPRVDQPLFSAIRNNRTGELGRALDPSMIFYVVRKYAKLAGIQSRVSPHSCRATAISNARDHNVPDRAIQEFAGWASPDMITRYDKRRSAIEKSAAHAIAYGSEQRRLPEWVAEYETRAATIGPGQRA